MTSPSLPLLAWCKYLPNTCLGPRFSCCLYADIAVHFLSFFQHLTSAPLGQHCVLPCVSVSLPRRHLTLICTSLVPGRSYEFLTETCWCADEEMGLSEGQNKSLSHSFKNNQITLKCMFVKKKKKKVNLEIFTSCCFKGEKTKKNKIKALVLKFKMVRKLFYCLLIHY